MKPARKRKVVRYLQEGFRISERRACRLMELSRTSHRYQSTKTDDPVLRHRLGELAAARPRFGYRRLCVLLRREGWAVNQKRVYRIYREEGLEVRTKKRRRKRASHVRLLVPPAQRPNERWSMDFVTDRLENLGLEGTNCRLNRPCGHRSGATGHLTRFRPLRTTARPRLGGRHRPQHQ